MGVYINMEMPDGCVVCPFFIENHHDRGDDSLCRASGKEAKCGCPLVPVPPHGRLIDADALTKEVNRFCDQYDAGIISTSTWANGILYALFNAPTVIEAEEGE